MRRCTVKRILTCALVCALIISLLTGCVSVRQNELPESEPAGGEYSLRAAVVYDSSAPSGFWEDTLSRLEQPLLFGLEAGGSIKAAAIGQGVDPLFAGLPVIVLVTSGGFLTNAAYCLWQNAKNRTFGDYGKGSVWGNNLVFCALAGVLWYSQFFGLEMGKSFLDGHATLLAFSWSILMALNVTFSNVWGILLKEWKGCGRRTVGVLLTGLVILVGSIVLVAVAQQ